MRRWSGALIGVQRSALVLFSMRTLQENETLEQYYTTIHSVVYSAVGAGTALLLHYRRLGAVLDLPEFQSLSLAVSAGPRRRSSARTGYSGKLS